MFYNGDNKKRCFYAFYLVLYAFKLMNYDTNIWKTQRKNNKRLNE